MDVSHATPDGSPVAVYLATPAGDTPTIIHNAIGADADILELGCGAGRITRVLVAYGHHVVGVDDDAAMLEHVTGAETVLGDLFQLDLGRRFGAVVAGSHLINAVDPAERVRLLSVCAQHVRPDGVVLVERYPASWAERPTGSSGSLGPVETTLTIHDIDAEGFRATVEYRLGDRAWQQKFASANVDDDALARHAAEAGLEVVDWLDDARTWARLRPSSS